MNTTHTVSVTLDDLRAQGFSAAQLERLSFLKWRYQQGQVAVEAV